MDRPMGSGDRDSFPSDEPIGSPSSSARNIDHPTGGSSGPRGMMRSAAFSPNEVAAAKAVMDRHIENGDISREDIAMIRGTTRTASVSSTIGSTGFGALTYFMLKRRTKMAFGMRLVYGGLAGMMGSFVGLAVGSAVAAWEVSNKMPDAQNKMRVFAEIAKESSQAIAEQRRQNTTMDGDDPGRPFPDPDTPMRSAPTPQDPSGREQSEIRKVSQTAWDTLRQNNQNPPARSANATAPMSARRPADDERTKEKREFDEMLDRERRGVDSEQKWS